VVTSGIGAALAWPASADSAHLKRHKRAVATAVAKKKPPKQRATATLGAKQAKKQPRKKVA
jgi:hypothetical protein